MRENRTLVYLLLGKEISSAVGGAKCGKYTKSVTITDASGIVAVAPNESVFFKEESLVEATKDNGFTCIQNFMTIVRY